MYSHDRIPIRVRDGGVPYGWEPTPAETFPAERVLKDLTGAPVEEMDRILARYAALRAWMLRSGRAERALVRHAVDAAREHLAAVPPDWPEGKALSRLLRRRSRAGSIAVLEDAAEEAAGMGHEHGARALREVAHRVRLASARLPPPSPS